MDLKRFKELVAETWIDLPNTVLSKDAAVTERVRRVSKLEMTVMHMATTHVGVMINIAASCLGADECYVNIGTWKGYSFFAAFKNNWDVTCIGNDNFSLFTGNRGVSLTELDYRGRDFGDTKAAFYQEFNRLKHDNQIFIEKDWKEFLKEFPTVTDKKIGFYFYDGDHSFEAQYEALKLVQPYLSEKCAILVDDTNLPQVAEANKKFLSEYPDFILAYDLPTPYNRYPTWWDGLQILTRG